LEFNRGTQLSFTFDGALVTAYEGETIAAALYAAGFRTLARSHNKNRARGLYCAIGNCSSCTMVVNGESNVKVCVTLAEEGMTVETQKDKGRLTI